MHWFSRLAFAVVLGAGLLGAAATADGGVYVTTLPSGADIWGRRHLRRAFARPGRRARGRPPRADDYEDRLGRARGRRRGAARGRPPCRAPSWRRARLRRRRARTASWPFAASTPARRCCSTISPSTATRAASRACRRARTPSCCSRRRTAASRGRSPFYPTRRPRSFCGPAFPTPPARAWSRPQPSTFPRIASRWKAARSSFVTKGILVVAHLGDVTVRFDGVPAVYDGAPETIAGRLYLPLELLKKLTDDPSKSK